MEQQNFKIKSRNEEFRIAKISPVELLALQTQIDFNSLNQTTTTFNFILEHIEVKLVDQWIKVKNNNIYMPVDLEQDLMALQELVLYFLSDYLAPLFKKSNE